VNVTAIPLREGLSANIADLALETRLAEHDADLSRVCFALKLESMIAGRERSKLFEIATRIGLSPDATGAVLDQCEYRARLLNEAHVLLRALIPFEPQIRAMVDAKSSTSAQMAA
jgi:hypothetical protein